MKSNKSIIQGRRENLNEKTHMLENKKRLSMRRTEKMICFPGRNV